MQRTMKKHLRIKEFLQLLKEVIIVTLIIQQNLKEYIYSKVDNNKFYNYTRLSFIIST